MISCNPCNWFTSGISLCCCYIHDTRNVEKGIDDFEWTVIGPYCLAYFFFLSSNVSDFQLYKGIGGDGTCRKARIYCITAKVNLPMVPSYTYLAPYFNAGTKVVFVLAGKVVVFQGELLLTEVLQGLYFKIIIYHHWCATV